LIFWMIWALRKIEHSHQVSKISSTRGSRLRVRKWKRKRERDKRKKER
jgi:hypothetical protein